MMENKSSDIIVKSTDWLFNMSSSEKPLSKGNVASQTKIKRGYKGIVYSCASIIAKDASTTKWWFEDKSGKIIDENNDAYKLLKKPNSLMTWNDIIEISQLFLELVGNVYWYVAKSKTGKPIEIWLIPPYNVKPEAKKDEFGIDYYKAIGIPGIRRFETNEIVHFKYQNPNNMYVGMGTLDAALVEADINNFSKQYVMNFYKNGAIPAGILTTKEKVGKSDAERIELKWNNKYQGSDNSWGVAVLWGGFEYKSISLNPATEKFIEQSQWSRQDIASIFKVPLSKLGIVEDVNRANADANNRTYMENCISPKLSMIERKINVELLPLLGIPYVFKFEEVVPEDKQFALDQQKLNVQRAQIGGMFGVLSGDEIRELLGFDKAGMKDTIQIGKDVEEVERLIKVVKEFSIK